MQTRIAHRKRCRNPRREFPPLIDWYRGVLAGETVCLACRTPTTGCRCPVRESFDPYTPPAPVPETQTPTKMGSVVRRNLSDGRPYPETLAAQQFGFKQCQLLDDRLQDALGGGFLVLPGRSLDGAQCISLLTFMQMQLLPEIYDPDYRAPVMKPARRERNCGAA